MKHLKYDSRLIIKEMRDRGMSIQAVADELGVCWNTIHNELRRGANTAGEYDPDYAEKQYWNRQKSKGRTPILMSSVDLAKRISELILTQGYSPKQILGILKKEFPDEARNLKSVNTIYSAIDKGFIPGVTRANLRSNETKMSSEGVACIPKWIREELKLQDGDIISIEISDAGAIILNKRDK